MLQACSACKHARHISFVSPARKRRYSSAPGLVADLGLRYNQPPDSHPPGKDSQESDIVSDQDWEIRTGRAIYVLQQTLPEFFSTGLITSVDKATGAPRLPQNASHAQGNSLDYAGIHTPRDQENIEPIYGDSVRLSYTPPTVLPAPFPRVLHLEGLPLYLASSVFVRHTMNALYSDLHVVLRRVIVNTPTSSSGPSSRPGSASSPPQAPLPLPSSEDDANLGGASYKKKSRINREKNLFISLTVAGNARLGGSPGEWEVNSTYTFSPLSGLIHTHIVNSIHPAPHQAVYDALRLSLGKVFGFDGGVGGAGQVPGGVHIRTECVDGCCDSKDPSGRVHPCGPPQGFRAGRI
ncbi:hypothetical protein BDN72DRAFT_849299 [Pluteus cervinus]|uniref:Uncharacterized protein n=1 Tax=Pluteus cervinus TaxID=181527 RepID=A0ACD3AAK7_9AGAR|nr:hypothetical protein BDN72DRAFT_849299 [Pluteus cervinus]